MTHERPSSIAPICLVVGALLGLVGSFAPSASVRGLAWGVDGTALIVGAALLAVHFIRCAQNLLAAGFLFIAGETLVVSGSAMSLEASGPSFAAGAALWAAALVLVSAPNIVPMAPVCSASSQHYFSRSLRYWHLLVVPSRHCPSHSRFSPIHSWYLLCVAGRGGAVALDCD